ncbi:MAG TPA: hypothetical protein VNT54_10880 [Solirubrobacteraceae bacterium]|nr:hypothetical protein [Solirubrobacteraceae bacterium]
MRRIAVVGPGGAGKSTFSRELGQRLAIAVVHLDRHFWNPGWVATPRPAWRAAQAELLAGEAWIAAATTARRSTCGWRARTR